MRARAWGVALTGVVALAVAGALVVPGVRDAVAPDAAPRPTASTSVSTGTSTSGSTSSGATERHSAQASGPTADTRPTDGPPSFDILMSGDILVHSPLIDQAARDAAGSGAALDFLPMMRAQRPRVAAPDLAICNLETPIARPGGPYSGYPTFATPAQITTAIRALGYDACTTASNHTLDQGFEGVTRTLDVLDARGIRHTGSARSQRERDTPLLLKAGDAQVGLVGYTFGTNGIPVPAAHPYAVNVTDPSKVLADAKRARRAGADVVIVMLQAGTEYAHTPDATQLALADRLTRSTDVDLVYMHHTHTIQPFAKVNGKWVAYGLGNSFARSTLDPNPTTGEQVMSRFTFTRNAAGAWRVTQAEYIPGYSPFEAPYRWVDLSTAAADASVPSQLRASYRARLSHIRSIMGARGAFKDGLRAAEPLP